MNKLKQLFSASVILILLLSFDVNANNTKKPSPAPNCCSANCKMGSCNINGTASACVCSCDPKGNPKCEAFNIGGGSNDVTYTICANQNQMANLNGVLSLYQNFNSQAGASAAAIVSSIIDLFNNNNYYLDDNSPNGNVESYHVLRANLDLIQFSNNEWASLNQFLSQCTEGKECENSNN